MKSLLVLVVFVALVGCGGSGAPAGNQTSHELEELAPLHTQLAVGQSERISYHEHTCHSTSDSRGMGEFNKTCDSWFTPQLTAAVVANTGSTAQCSVVVVGLGTIQVTKNSASDPNNATCTFSVSDPQTGANTNPQA